jgi:hypothetical protein
MRAKKQYLEEEEGINWERRERDDRRYKRITCCYNKGKLERPMLRGHNESCVTKS